MSFKELIEKASKSEFHCKSCGRISRFPFQKHFWAGHVCEGEIIEKKWVSVEALKPKLEAIQTLVLEVEAVVWATCEEGSVGREKMRELKDLVGLEENK